jgi:hypothetical protein
MFGYVLNAMNALSDMVILTNIMAYHFPVGPTEKLTRRRQAVGSDLLLDSVYFNHERKIK